MNNIIYIENKTLPLSSISFSFDFGYYFVNKEISELPHLIEHLFFVQNSLEKSREKLNKILSEGGKNNAYTTNFYTSYIFSYLSELFPKKLNYILDSITFIDYDEKEIEKEKEIIKSELNMYYSNPDYYIYDLIDKSTFYNSKLYKGLKDGLESLKNISKNYIIEYKSKYYTVIPKVFIYGNVNRDLIKKIEDFFSTFSNRKFSLNSFEINPKDIEEYRGKNNFNVAYYFLLDVNNGLNFLVNFKKFYYLMVYGLDSIFYKEIREKLNASYYIDIEYDVLYNFGDKSKVRIVILIFNVPKNKLENVDKKVKEIFDKYKENALFEREYLESKYKKVKYSLIVEDKLRDYYDVAYYFQKFYKEFSILENPKLIYDKIKETLLDYNFFVRDSSFLDIIRFDKIYNVKLGV